MFEKILLPVDLSEHSRAAFGHAALLASAFGSSLELVHVVEHVVSTYPTFWSRELVLADDLHEQAVRSAEASLQKIVPQLTPIVPAVSARVLSGTLPGTLVEHAEAVGAGLIVVSTHGRTGFARWLLGSVSERLLRVAPCPVLVARGGSVGNPAKIGRILVAVDLSEQSRRALSIAAAMAEKLGALLEVLYVWAAPFYGEGAREQVGLFERIRETARSELDTFVRTAGVSSALTLEETIVSGNPTPEILDRAQQTRPDLLVLGTHGRGGFKRLVLGSVAEAATRYAECATLVVG